MTTGARTSWLVVAAVVATAILGGAYTLGHTVGRPGGLLGPAQNNPQNRSGAGSTAASPTATAQPTASPSASPTAESGELPAPDHGPPQLPAERGGPFGARVSTGASQVALTFDDGPDPRYTPQILDILRTYSVKATFCLVGSNARAYPELVRQIAADGHTLCNHSWLHDLGLGARSRVAILTDLARTNQAIRTAVPDAPIPYFRQPGGNWTPSVVATARQLGMTSLHWAGDPRDWTLPGSGNIVTSVTGNAAPGAIVLLHDAGGNRQGTVNALYPILSNLGRRFGLVALPSGPPPEATATAVPPQAGAAPDPSRTADVRPGTTAPTGPPAPPRRPTSS